MALSLRVMPRRVLPPRVLPPRVLPPRVLPPRVLPSSRTSGTQMRVASRGCAMRPSALRKHNQSRLGQP